MRRYNRSLNHSSFLLPSSSTSSFTLAARSFAFTRFVLCHHSAYFRTYIQSLKDGQRAYPAEECSGHTDITHCIRLPKKCGREEADGAAFRLFLCHLYFTQCYSLLPYQAPSTVDMTTQPPPSVTLEFQKIEAIQLTAIPHSMYAQILSLCHYFNCAVVLLRAEDK